MEKLLQGTLECKNCEYHQEIIVTNPPEIDDTDIKVYDNISTRLSTSEQLMNMSEKDVDDVTGETVKNPKSKIFYEIAVDKYLEARCLLSEWWLSMIKKYKIPTTAKVDTIAGVFYHCVDKNGNPTDGVCKTCSCSEDKCSEDKCSEDKCSEDKCSEDKCSEDKCSEDKCSEDKCSEDKCSCDK